MKINIDRFDIEDDSIKLRHNGDYCKYEDAHDIIKEIQDTLDEQKRTIYNLEVERDMYMERCVDLRIELSNNMD